MQELAYDIRRATADDMDYVFDAWLSSWRTSRWAGTVPNHLYFGTQRTLIEDLLARGMVILVADAGKTLLGFVAGEVKDGKTVLHYSHIKDLYVGRVPGLEERLLAALPGEKPGFFTHYQRFSAKLPEWRWAPEMARRKIL